MKNKKIILEKIFSSNYTLKEIFADSYEYEIYFQLANSINISNLCPNQIEIDFSTTAKRTRLYFPEDEIKLIKIIVPITKAQNNQKKRSELRTQHFHKYGELVSKIRFSTKNQLAALRKDLINENEKKLIDKKVKQSRLSGLKKTEMILNKRKI